MEIDTAPGRGTTVRIHLPPVPESPPDKAAPNEDAPPIGRVLCIDDDPRLRLLISGMLQRLEQQVDLADGGAAGLEAFQSNRDQYDLVITDLGMPGVDGNEVTRVIKTLRPHVPVVMLTGWGSDLEEVAEGPTPDRVLAKPVTIQCLRETLAELLPTSGELSHR